MSTRAGLELIKEFEGFRANAYLCPAGVPTIGYGETQGVKLGMTTTEPEAAAKLEKRYDEFEAGVLKNVKVTVTENQLGALVSFAYNLGVGNLQRSTLIKLLNAGDYTGAANEFGKWTMAAGKVLPGLVRRRAAEKALFLKA